MKKLVLAKWDNELERHIGAAEVERLENIEWTNHATHIFFCGPIGTFVIAANTAEGHRNFFVKTHKTRTNGNEIAAWTSLIDWDQVAELSQLSSLQKEIIVRGNKARYPFALPISA